jgi:hypothetical protein
MPEYPIGFYVYRLIDPRSGLAFYVGKGQNGRAWQHEKDVRAGNVAVNPRKCSIISDILNAGFCVQVEIAGVFDDEVEALDLEFKLVEANPTLTNVMPGGIGPTWVDSPFRAQKRREAYERKRKRLVAERNRREAQKRKDQVERWAASRVDRCRGGERHKDVIDPWVERIKFEALKSVPPIDVRRWRGEPKTRSKNKVENPEKRGKRRRRYSPGHGAFSFPRFINGRP